jgi:hypothetical protein
MKNIVIILWLISFVSLKVTGQRLSIPELTMLKGLSLNNAETLLSKKKFEFKEVRESDDKRKDYAFSFNLDKYGNKGEEYLVLLFENSDKAPYMVWYQLDKQGWLKIKNTLESLGYKKTKTNTQPDGSLSTEYSNSKFKFSLTSGKSNDGENNGFMIYTLAITLK